MLEEKTQKNKKKYKTIRGNEESKKTKKNNKKRKENKRTLIVKLLVRHIKSNKDLYKSFNYSRTQQKYSLSEYLDEIM